MPTTSFDKDSIKASIIGKLQRYNGRTIEEASNGQIYRALASTTISLRTTLIFPFLT